MAYFANGCEGEVLNMQCAECPIGRHPEAPCPVLEMQTFYNYDQIGNDLARDIMNTLIDAKGNCRMKPIVEKYACAEPQPEMYPRDVIPSMRKWAEERGLIRKI